MSECNKKVTNRSKDVESECCLNWYHVNSGDTSDDEFFLRYVDDIVRTVKGDPENVLRAAYLLLPSLQFTI